MSSKYWLCRKVVCLVGYYGGFRNVEMQSLQFENVECDSMGYWFTFSRSKQRNKLEETTICVPRRQSDWIGCAVDSARKAVDYDPASVIDSYIEAVMQDLNCKREELKGGFFKGTHGKSGKRFVNANVGKNTLAQVGIEIASELCLRDPETFTGHCWRRSAGTNASNAGVNVTTLMSMMGWACPKTAMQYVKRSRITSLQMSMYLANVQRSNCSDPFPSKSERKSRKKKFRCEKDLTELLSTSTPDTKTTPTPTTTTPPPPPTTTTTTPMTTTQTTTDSLGLNRSSFSEIEKFEAEICEKHLLNDGASKFENVTNGGAISGVNLSSASNVVNESGPVVSTAVTAPVLVPSNPLSLSSVDPRLVNFLQNLQNHGSIQIHFNFGDVNK